jgi:hypothetical protein
MSVHETWVPIAGFEGAYEVSNLGRVRALDREIFTEKGRYGKPAVRVVRGNVLSLALCSNAYLAVTRKHKCKGLEVST